MGLDRAMTLCCFLYRPLTLIAADSLGINAAMRGHTFLHPALVKKLVLPVLALVEMMLGATFTPLLDITCIAGAI